MICRQLLVVEKKKKLSFRKEQLMEICGAEISQEGALENTLTGEPQMERHRVDLMVFTESGDTIKYFMQFGFNISKNVCPS